MEQDQDKFLTPEDMRDLVEKKSSSYDFEILDYSIKRIDRMMGYLGMYYNMTIRVQQNSDGKKNVEELHFFLKRLPLFNETQTKITVETGAFCKEVAAYTKLFPLFKNTSWAPECYLGRDDDILVLDDLGRLGYKIGVKTDRFGLDRCRLVIEKMAVFHAQSMIFEENSKQRGERANIREQFSQYFNEVIWTVDETNRAYRFSLASFPALVAVLNEFKAPSEKVKALQHSVPELLHRAFQATDPSDKFRNVVCHGDFKSENILFQVINDKLVDCKFVDFQLIRYLPPATDLLFFLNIVTSFAFRKTHEEELLRYYHELVGSTLKAGGLSVDKVFPLDNFLESCRFYKPTAVMQTLIYCHLVMLDTKITEEYFSDPVILKQMFKDKTEVVMRNFKSDPIYRDIIYDTMISYEEVYDSLYS